MKEYTNGNDRYRVTKMVGRYTYGDELITIKEPGADLTIGSFCAIGQSVKVILGSYHRVDWITSFPFGQNATDVFTKFNHLPYNTHNVTVTNGDIVIGNDVWLGDCVNIMSGVTIGHGSAIGAHSVIAKDIPPYSVVVGNPGKVIRKKFNDEDIEFLLDLKWWDLQDDIINEITPILCSGNIQKLREYFETHPKIYIINPINKKLTLDWGGRKWSDGTDCPIGYNA